MPDYEWETRAENQGYSLVCGVDEAGRGPLAGPVCVAAVILPTGTEIPGLNDSKKLSEKKREALFDVILQKAVAAQICFADVSEIEEKNILGATMAAMARAVGCLNPAADYALIDGNRIPGNLEIPAEAVVKGDVLCMSIAAASVLAKVSRDRLMLEYDRQYPEYGFAAHKGYGTAAHYAAIRRYGICPIHRPSFLKKMKWEE